MSTSSSSKVLRLPSMSSVTLNYVVLFAIWLIVYFILNHFWGDRMLLSFGQLEGRGFAGIVDGLTRVWFIFVWGAVVTLLVNLVKRGAFYVVDKDAYLARGWWVSLNAGIFEELTWRWLIFFSAMVWLPLFNFLTFGLVEWLNTAALIPLANWETQGYLAPQLLHSGGWVIGAALVSAANSFGDAHKHLGLFGRVNAWFIGMILFYLMFNYGIITAMAAHVLYDLIVFTAVGLIAKEHTLYQSMEELADAVVASIVRSARTRARTTRRTPPF